MAYYERNLPHWHPEGKAIFLTWRLYGSLPAAALKHLATLRAAPGKQFAAAEKLLDHGNSGPFWLRDPKIAVLVKESILRGERLGQYTLCSYVVMPNHVHVLLEPRLPLSRITRGLKGVSSRDANALLGRKGQPFWQEESFDHWIRDGAQFERVRWYIENNPVKAGLVKSPLEWPWSSAQ